MKLIPWLAVGAYLFCPVVSAWARGSVHVRGYTRKDGTYVHPYTRSAPGSGSGGVSSGGAASAGSVYESPVPVLTPSSPSFSTPGITADVALTPVYAQYLQARAFLLVEQGRRFDELATSVKPLTAAELEEFQHLLMVGLTQFNNYEFYSGAKSYSKYNQESFDKLDKVLHDNLAALTALRDQFIVRQASQSISLPSGTPAIPSPSPLGESSTPVNDPKMVIIGIFDSTFVSTDATTKLRAFQLLVGEAKRQGITILCPKDSIWWSSSNYRTVDLTPCLTELLVATTAK